jgi:hypothetical protein
LVEKPEARRLLGRSRCRRENFKMDLKNMGKGSAGSEHVL